MGGGQDEVSSSNPSNPDVNPTVSKLLKGVQSTYDASQVQTPPALTSGWASQLGAAGNADYARGVAGSTSELADIASGKRFGMDDPGYASMRQGALDDALTGVGSSFLTDGRFGSSVMGDAAGQAATQTLAGLDYQNYTNDQNRQFQAISALPTAFAAGQAPGSVQQSVGEQQRANPWFNLGQASNIASGNYGAGGQTQTQPGTPWWQSALGYVAGNAGKAVGSM